MLDWEDFGGIQKVHSVFQDIFLIHDLHRQLPLRIVTGIDRVEQILAMEIRVLASNSLSLFPYHTSQTLLRLEMEFDELGFSFVIDEAEGMDTETVHMTIRARDTVWGKSPDCNVNGEQTNISKQVLTTTRCAWWKGFGQRSPRHCRVLWRPAASHGPDGASRRE